MSRDAKWPAPEWEAGHQDLTAVAAAERRRAQAYWLVTIWWVAW